MPSTHEIDIFDSNILPDNSGDMFFEPYSVTDTATVFNPLIARFNDTTTRVVVSGAFKIPENYDSSAQMIWDWTANASTGDVNIGMAYLTVSTGEDFGGAATSTATGTFSKGATAFSRERSVIELTSTDFARGDLVLFDAFVSGDESTTTLAAALLAFEISFRFLSTA